MAIQRHDIYLIRYRLRNSYDFRPCVVLAAPTAANTDVILATSSDLHRPGYDFQILKDHPDFAATGLKKNTYVMGDQIYTVPASMLNTKLGHLEGALAKAFDKWID
jgi:mRNA-degrading endonuclease toxin of MazEF toxin-antitoxin module